MIDVGVHVKSYIQNTNNNNINNKYSLKLQRRNNEIGADKLIQLNNLKKKQIKTVRIRFFLTTCCIFLFVIKLKLFFSCQLIVFPVNHLHKTIPIKEKSYKWENVGESFLV